MYMAFKPNTTESLHQIISTIYICVIDINVWVTANMLQLNVDLTEVLVLMTSVISVP